MAKVNINQAIVDPFYRYKMPVLSVRYMKNSTILENLQDVATALGRDYGFILTFFGYKFGTIVKEKKSSINGIYAQESITCALSDFISQCVLCDKCENPETTLKVKSTRVLKTCKACGSQSYWNPDKVVFSKLVNYLIKQHEAKKVKKRRKKVSLAVAAPDEDETEYVFETDTSAEAVAARRKEFF